MRVVIRRGRWLSTLFRPLGLTLLSLLAIGVVGGASAFTFYYVRYSRLIDERLRGPVFPNVSQIYAAPEVLRLGQPANSESIASHLRRAGYTEERGTPRGWYQRLPGGIRIVPGPESYFAPQRFCEFEKSWRWIIACEWNPFVAFVCAVGFHAVFHQHNGALFAGLRVTKLIPDPGVRNPISGIEAVAT